MAERISEYDELKVRIERDASGGYRVLAFAADGRTGRGTFAPPLRDEELDAFVRGVGLARRAARSHSERMQDVKRFGSDLFAALMSDRVGEIYHAAREAAEQQGRGLRITLYLSGAPELMRLPWEFLYRRPRFLSQSTDTPVVRSLDLESARRACEVEPPLRILGVVSSPTGYPELDADDERRKLEQALGPLQREGVVEVQWLARATLAELGRRIAEPDDVHVLHYIGHGAYDEASESGILVLETAHGRAHDVSGEELGTMLQDERSLRLVVLNSCEGARTSRIDPFSGVAASLMEFEIPAVIAMQFEITDEAAIAFSESLYTELVQGLPVDAALGPARRAIVGAEKEAEFGTPVLFLRGANTHLFDLGKSAPQTSAAPAHPVVEAGEMPSLGQDASPGSGADRDPRSAETRDVSAGRITPDLGFGSQLTYPWGHEPERVSEVVTGIALNAAAFSLDGRRLATSHADGTVRLRDTVTGTEQIRILQARVGALAFSSDGLLLATGSDDGMARIWNAATGHEENCLIHEGAGHIRFPDVKDVAFAPDGRSLATASYDRTARAWDVNTGQETLRVSHGDWVYAVVFHPDGQRLATASKDATARVWNVLSAGQELQLPHGWWARRAGGVYDVAFSPDGRLIATASSDVKDGHARVWDSLSGKEELRVSHRGTLTAGCDVGRVVFGPTASLLATVGSDGTARVWDIATSAELARFAHGAAALRFSSDGRQIAIASADGTMRVYEFAARSSHV